MREPRFPAVPPRAGHYESYFVKAHHPSAAKAFWLRHTIHQRPGQPRTGSLWLTLFDGDRVSAGKQTVAGAGAPPGGYVEIAGASLGPRGGRGTLRSPTLDAEWDFAVHGEEPEQRHLPARWMYDARLPRTKSGTPQPAVTLTGRVGPFDVDGWVGLLSHNWGSEHAERWIWLHCGQFDGHGPDTWLELVLGRVRAGRWTTPWLANGGLQLGGARHRLGGLRSVRATRVDEAPTRARFTVAGVRGVRVAGEIAAPAQRFVCWRYADPAGPEHHSAHSSLADLRLEVRRDGAPPLTLTAEAAASYELGMRETGHGLAVQPYDDGHA